MTVQLGQTVKLDCTAGGYPEPTIGWSRVEHVTQSSDVVTNGSLIIDRVTKEDEGQYFCIAKNALGKKVHGVTLQLPKDSNGVLIPAIDLLINFGNSFRYI